MAITDPTTVPTPTGSPVPTLAPVPGDTGSDFGPVVDALNAITLQVDTLTVALVLVAVLVAVVAGFVIVRSMA